MYCPYCGTKLEDDQTFCHICGESQIFEEDEMSPDKTYAPKESAYAQTAARSVKTEASGSVRKKMTLAQRFPFFAHLGIKRLVLCSAAAVSLIVLLVTVVCLIFREEEPRIFAAAEGNMVCYSGEEVRTVENSFVDPALEAVLGSTPSVAMHQMMNAVIGSRDILCYLDSYNTADKTWSLKRVELQEEDPAVVIDSGVYSEMNPGTCGQAGELSCEWKMNLTGSVIFYIKNMGEKGGALYRYADGISSLVASGCVAFDISPDGERVCWVGCDKSGAACILNVASFASKALIMQLDTQFFDAISYDDDFNTIYYTRNSFEPVNPLSVYAAGYSTEKERLVAGVSRVNKVSDKGRFFYTSTGDDGAEQLGWFSRGGAERMVSKTCSSIVLEVPEFGYVIYSVETRDNIDFFLYADGVTYDFDDRWVTGAVCNEKGDIVYLTLYGDGVGTALYQCRISSSHGISQPEQIFDRCSQLMYDNDSDTLFFAVYSKESTDISSLYMWDGTQAHLVSDHAYPMVVYSGKSWAFFTDVSSAKYTEESPHLASGTLNVFLKGEVVDVDENVSMLFWHFEGKDKLVYIKDYVDAFGGSLYIAKPGKPSERIAIDVQAIWSEEACLEAFGE